MPLAPPPLAPPGAHPRALPVSPNAIERTARIFRALGEAPRIRLVAHLAHGEACVTDLAAWEQQPVTVISQRLRVLRADNIVERRRKGRHILYFLSDRHVTDLVLNGLAHASEQASNHASRPAPDRALQQEETNVTT